LEEGVVDLFSKIVKEDGLEIDMEVVDKPKTIDKYVQAWHNQIWEHGFKGKDSYSKTKIFFEHMHTDLAVKRVVFRYEFISQMALNSIILDLWIEANLLSFL
jgi:alpha-glucuronidase